MKINVLVFPCGTEVALEVNRALADSKHFALFGGNSVEDHGRFVYRNYIPGLPFADDPRFLSAIRNAVATFKIDFIIPTHDSAVLQLAEHQDQIGAPIVTSTAATCRVCRSKKSTYKLFEGIIATPIVYSLQDTINQPVFLKPDIGQGTKGTYKANTAAEMVFYLNKDPTLLALEYLPGKEYTVECFTNRKGVLLFVAGRERSRINNGISVNSAELGDGRFQSLAEAINRKLSLRGAWFFQVKERSTGELVLLEIAPRIAGTSALFRADGPNLVQLSLYDRMGVDVSILRNNLPIVVDRALFSRFSVIHEYACVYIDFDDTIVVDDAVNTNIIRFLYQCRNLGKEIVLLSRHPKEITESLRSFSISELLFDEIIILGDGERKSDYITNMKSIFIDDSFAERKEVSNRLHIPVFALDAVESLMDWKA